MSKARRAYERRRHQRAAQAKRRQDQAGIDPAAAQWADWQDHQYLEGYEAGKPSDPGLDFRRDGLSGKLLVVGSLAPVLALVARVVLSGYPQAQQVVGLGLGGLGIGCVLAAFGLWLWKVMRGKDGRRRG